MARTFTGIEDAMRYRLRMSEVIPFEMSQYRIGALRPMCRLIRLLIWLGGGRVYFIAPKLFELSLCLRGAGQRDGWFFVNVTFLFTVGGDQTGMQGTLLT